MTKAEQDVVNVLPKLCDAGTCKTVILMIDELDTLRDTVKELKQAVDNYDGTMPSMITQFTKIQEILESL